MARLNPGYRDPGSGPVVCRSRRGAGAGPTRDGTRCRSHADRICTAARGSAGRGSNPCRPCLARRPGRRMRFALVQPLRHRHYRLLFAGQVISNVGDWLTILALISLVVYEWDLGPSAWGWVLTALTLPFALA